MASWFTKPKPLAKGNLAGHQSFRGDDKITPPEARKQFSKLKIIFEDEYILVVDKLQIAFVATEKLEKDTLPVVADHVKRQSDRTATLYTTR